MENRTWHPSRQGGSVGMFLALHGGSDKINSDYANEIMDALVWMEWQGCNLPSIHPNSLSAVVHSGIIAVAQLVDVRRDSPSPWAAQNQYHWCLKVTPLPEAVPHRGAQGLWTLEPEALARVRELYQAVSA
ncbi:hypothetical protein ACFP9V_19310 [Deinococcus radiopugnans]|uniref:hypothetical protein n=1 Tax=Deinococcus radiopugnans TaxID=57497 RepID=UPI00360D6D1C